jgi:hypothetical protein
MSFELLEDINNMPDGLSVSNKFNKKLINVAKVVTDEKNSYIYLEDNDKTIIQSNDHNTTRFEPIIPYNNIQRWVCYIYGQSGNGKSVLASQLAIQYKTLNPKNKVFYMCSTDISCDQNFSKLDFVKTLDIDKIYSFDMSQDEERDMIKNLLSNSLIIFDDLDMAKNKKLITALQFKLIEVGRKFGCSIIIITHVNCAGHTTKLILNELDLYFCFKSGLKNNRLLETYNGYKKEDLEKIKTNSWCLFNLRYNCLITPQEVRKI